MGGKRPKKDEGQAAAPSTQQQASSASEASAGTGEDVGQDEVQQRFDEAEEKGFFGETFTPYDPDEFAAPPGGNEGRQAQEDRAKRVNPEGHGRATPDRVSPT